jgi:histidyl-tRNA synthetase
MSANTFQTPVGTRDVLGPDSGEWEGIIALFAEMAYRAGFQLAIQPMFEDVGVFNRGIGEESEVATKEMYTFTDRGDRWLALRPEGTASVVRAFVQHHPVVPFKAWYASPVFRYERPQAGRYRQHHQLGVEVLGTEDPDVDVEVIALAHDFYRSIGLTQVTLMVNSMGHVACRSEYVSFLLQHLTALVSDLCEEHQKTFQKNPLRVLDCKKESCVAVTNAGPMLPDYLCDECSLHFGRVTAGLDELGILWRSNPRLVRGFDYYTRTTFEFSAASLDAAQNAIGGGGRYDQLAAQLGGDDTPGIGFGIGIERLLLARAAEGVSTTLLRRTLDVFVVDTVGTESNGLVHTLRRAGFAVDRAYDGRSMKAQMKAADRSGARVALLVGPQEVGDGQVTLRDLRTTAVDTAQISVPRQELIPTLHTFLKDL